MSQEFKAIRAKHPSPLAAVYALARCMAAMADTPETLSNSLAFLQMDLVDPDFHQHALAHSRGMQAGIKALLDEAVDAGELATSDTDSPRARRSGDDRRVAAAVGNRPRRNGRRSDCARTLMPCRKPRPRGVVARRRASKPSGARERDREGRGRGTGRGTGEGRERDERGTGEGRERDGEGTERDGREGTERDGRGRERDGRGTGRGTREGRERDERGTGRGDEEGRERDGRGTGVKGPCAWICWSRPRHDLLSTPATPSAPPVERARRRPTGTFRGPMDGPPRRRRSGPTARPGPTG